MKSYSNSQLETISIADLKKMLIAVTDKRVKTYINSNDKEPIWDGFIYLYKERITEKNDDLLMRVPIQVKSKEVSKFSNKYVSYNIKRTALKAYYNEGGVLYFLIEVKENEDKLTETKIFYKVLIASEIKKILENMPEGAEKKAVHIDRILTKTDNFFKQCQYFNESKNLFGIDAINNMIPLSKLGNCPINILTANGVEDILRGEYVAYYTNKYNIKLPIKIDSIFTKISWSENNNSVSNDKIYFNYIRTKDSKGNEYITFGDRIKLYINKNELELENSSGNIVERYDTLDFLLSRILVNNIDISSKEKKKIQRLKEEKEFLKSVLAVCSRFKIDSSKIKLKDFKESDYKVINILLNVKKYDGLIGKAKSGTYLVLQFINYKIALLKINYENEINYYDFYDENIDLQAKYTSDNKNILLSRFVLINENLLASYNFNFEIVKRTLLPIKEYSDIIVQFYSMLIVYLIKAWDIVQNDCYIELIKYLENILEGYVNKDLKIVNNAQIEYRLNDYKLTLGTKKNLCKIKEETTSQDLKCGIFILLEDYEGFEKEFKKLSPEEKRVFESYPIYDLYLKRFLDKLES